MIGLRHYLCCVGTAQKCSATGFLRGCVSSVAFPIFRLVLLTRSGGPRFTRFLSGESNDILCLLGEGSALVMLLHDFRSSECPFNGASGAMNLVGENNVLRGDVNVFLYEIIPLILLF